jgi:hypothetical protein
VSELATVHHLVLYAVLIVATMLALDWLDTRRTRSRAPVADSPTGPGGA